MQDNTDVEEHLRQEYPSYCRHVVPYQRPALSQNIGLLSSSSEISTAGSGRPQCLVCDYFLWSLML